MGNQRVFQTEGIIIKRSNSGEADRMITVFTKRHGKLRAVAKGVRKLTSRRRGHLEVFNRVKLSIHQGRAIDSVAEADSVPGWQNGPYNLSVMSHAYYACELIDRLIPDREPHEEAYERFVSVLRGLFTDPGETASGHAVESFALYLLRHLGFLPEDRDIRGEEIPRYVESVIERKLRTPKLIRKLARS